MKDSLAEKLKRLGMKLGVDHIPVPAKQVDDFSVSQVIPGEEVFTINGTCYRITKLLDLDHFHGQALLMMNLELGLVAEWAHSGHLHELSTENVVFLDTETTGLSGGTGTFAFLVGVSRQSSKGHEFTQFLLRDPSEETAMLTSLSEYVSDASAIVTYNGKSFDIPLLNNRYLLHGLTSPFIDLAHIDLLPMARKIWKNKLASRRLSDVETEILRVERSLDEVPGYLVPQVYFDYLRSGDVRPLSGVLYHNEMDVLSLFTLLQYFINSLSNLDPGVVETSGDAYPVIGLLLDLGETEKAIHVFNSIFQPASCSPEDDWDIIEKMGLHFRRNKEWDSAVLIWEAAAENGLEFGWFELTKFYEHQDRNYPVALEYAEKLLDFISNQNLPPFTKQQRVKELQTRINRIKVKHKPREKRLSQKYRGSLKSLI